MIPNVLAERYASPAISEIWSAEGRIILEREFWIAVMKAQKELGLRHSARSHRCLRIGQGSGQSAIHYGARTRSPVTMSKLVSRSSAILQGISISTRA